MVHGHRLNGQASAGSALLSGLAFAALHVPRLVAVDALPLLLVWVALPVILGLGLALSAIYRRWGLAAAIVTHTVYNLAVFSVGFAARVPRR